MQDISVKLLTYLEAKRHLWNVYFADKAIDLKACSALDDYEEIDKLLFSALVLREIGKDMDTDFIFGQDSFPYLKIIPREGIDQIEIMTCSIENDRKIWSNPWMLNIAHDCQFDFIEYFEWYRYGFVSYPYYLVKITKCDTHPELLNAEALIEISNAKVFFVA